jgi:hypothetical protein
VQTACRIVSRIATDRVRGREPFPFGMCYSVVPWAGTGKIATTESAIAPGARLGHRPLQSARQQPAHILPIKSQALNAPEVTIRGVQPNDNLGITRRKALWPPYVRLHTEQGGLFCAQCLEACLP